LFSSKGIQKAFAENELSRWKEGMDVEQNKSEDDDYNKKMCDFIFFRHKFVRMTARVLSIRRAARGVAAIQLLRARLGTYRRPNSTHPSKQKESIR
jgi:hypothetical protein